MNACHSNKYVAKSVDSADPQVENSSAAVPDYSGESNAPQKNKRKSPVTDEGNTSKEEAIKTTYAEKLGVSKDDITNYKLYHFIDRWYGTPYKYAGRSKSGVDCSDFTALLFKDVYNISISGAVTDIYKQCKPIKRSELKEGDLVFFKINRKSLSHVGVYLQNHKFVHASVHSGVIIDDLGEDYYKKYFRAAGRILE